MIYFEPLLFLIGHSIVSITLVICILFLIYVLNDPKPNKEKNIAYECGFKPFSFAYYPFDVQFYRVSILFLLFDVEIIFLFPWLLNFYTISWIGHITICIFICLLFMGLVYELKI